MLRSHVHQFQATPATPLPDPPGDSIATLGSHDLSTFATWWSGEDVEERIARGEITPSTAERMRARRSEIREGSAVGSNDDVERALEAHLEHLALGPARLVMVDLEDLWSEREPQNRPGTNEEYPNFRRRWQQLWPDDFADPTSSVRAALQAVDRARRLHASGAADARAVPDAGAAP